MTDATGDAGHPDVAEISDLAEGLLGPARSGEVRSHLDACALCADVRSSLEEIRGLLGTLPGPSRMPADVAGRIDAALAAEALLGTMEPGTGEAPQAEPTEIPDADVSRETSRDVSRETVAAETGPPQPSTAPAPPSSPSGAPGLGESARSGRPEGRGRAATGPGRKSGSGTRRRRLLLSSVLAAAAIGLGAVLVPTLSGAGSPGDEDSAASADAGPVYSDKALQEQVSALLSGTEAGGGRQEERTPGGGAGEKDEEASLGIQSSPGTPELNEPMMGTGPQVPPCVERAIARPEPALALERGRYQGTDAFLVVLPDHRDGARVTAYLVDAACADAGNEPGDVLLTRTYPRS
ncbi:hypothetical protein B9W68_15405 [Streptomyces sp. CS227]|uniref:hypothetical protein n=1 Tax=Streptomyces sp. CS227 TaxID=1982763 RepID=UPI000B41AB59|nr:hypothetical protein [Streptomyces sp. CS227]OWA11204.1 hypothetical protein B9W68_15405 [Streptomyces sp. CS227]